MLGAGVEGGLVGAAARTVFQHQETATDPESGPGAGARSQYILQGVEVIRVAPVLFATTAVSGQVGAAPGAGGAQETLSTTGVRGLPGQWATQSMLHDQPGKPEPGLGASSLVGDQGDGSIPRLQVTQKTVTVRTNAQRIGDHALQPIAKPGATE